ncbi:MAG: histidine phosphatase family protein [Angelakisella sp.]
MENVKTQNLTETQAKETPGLSNNPGRRVYFVRHGVTEWNKLYRYQGKTDIPLSAEGEDQALRVGLRFSALSPRPTKIFTSPLKRAMQTASIISEKLGCSDVAIVPELTEVDFGLWEGLTVAEIRALPGYSSVFDEWCLSQVNVTAPQGEDCCAVFERSVSVSRKIIVDEGENLVVVGHGAFFRTLFVSMLDVCRTNIFWRMRMDNCSVSALDIDRFGRASIAYLNDNLHNRVPLCEIPNIPVM